MTSDDQSIQAVSAQQSGPHGESPDAKVLVEVIELLRPFAEDTRLRLVDAALLFLNNTARTVRGPGIAPRIESKGEGVGSSSSDVDSETELPRRAHVWLKQNNLNLDDLGTVFHRSASGIELIAHQLPAVTKKESVQQCYLLSGVRSLLSSGEPRFTDEDARRVCKDLGCYDQDNHATNMRAIGNLMIGSKSSGFELTQPGLRAAAELMRLLVSGGQRAI